MYCFIDFHILSVDIQGKKDENYPNLYYLLSSFFQYNYFLSHQLLKIYILLIVLLQLSHFFPLYSPLSCTPLPPSFPHLSSRPWVIHMSSLASPFPILFLTSPCLFSTYHLCFLFPLPFPASSLLPIPVDNPPCDLYFCESVPVLVVCLVHFCFCLF